MTSKPDKPVSVRIGGRYIRNPETGETVREADAAPAPVVPAVTPIETTMPERPASKGKGN